ncbi:MAG TPA: hypothetical protein VN923_06520, partial [Thermoanaerobaculia bacterium]|nr:hypothetical protein [Thermoanaerobaculia bacterium]
MSDPMVNCVVDVQFDEGAARFSYSCFGSSRGWQVFPDGGIYPAMLGRVVQFRIKDFPHVKIAGFQVSAEELAALPPSHRWT